MLVFKLSFTKGISSMEQYLTTWTVWKSLFTIMLVVDCVTFIIKPEQWTLLKALTSFKLLIAFLVKAKSLKVLMYIYQRRKTSPFFLDFIIWGRWEKANGWERKHLNHQDTISDAVTALLLRNLHHLFSLDFPTFSDFFNIKNCSKN